MLESRDPESELALIEAMMARGRRAAALDGRHLIGWGGLAGLALLIQYFAEVGDWAPSSRLWLWQPALLGGFVLSLFLGRRAVGRRIGNPVARAYVAAFAGAGLTIALMLVASGVHGRPEPLAAVLVIAGALAAAFWVLAAVTELRWMRVPALGWWVLLGWYALRGRLVPGDFLVLAAAALLLLALPGLKLMRDRP